MEPNLVLITLASVLGATGIALVFVGVLMAMLVALGNKQYVYGVLIFILFPFAFIYSFVEREKMRYPTAMLWGGLALFCIFLILLWWELDYRLGLDFLEMLKTTSPKHAI